MIYLALGLILLGAFYGGRRGVARVAAGMRGALGVWRPTAGLSALVLIVLALVLVVREDWLLALVLGMAGLGLLLGARRSAARPTSVAGMSAQDARAILGLAPEANAAEVLAAYRRLIKTVHPDKGGTRGLAAQLTAARDVLKATAKR